MPLGKHVGPDPLGKIGATLGVRLAVWSFRARLKPRPGIWPPQRSPGHAAGWAVNDFDNRHWVLRFEKTCRLV